MNDQHLLPPILSKIPLLLLCIATLAASAQSLTAETTDEGVLVKEGADSVLFYQRALRSQRGALPRNHYIHPLYGLDGTVLTEDFPEDHPHHRGIFWAWHHVWVEDQPMGDSWTGEDFEWDVQLVEQASLSDGSLRLVAAALWKSPEWTDGDDSHAPFVSEETTITIYPKTAHYRVIDVDISLRALVSHVTLGGSDDEKGYGGFSVRMKLPRDVRFSSTGGTVTPDTQAVREGPWMNVSGSLAADGSPAGIVVMDHPNNPAFPHPWILRAEHSMQNLVYPGRTPVPVSQKQPTVLQYRLVVYKGLMSTEDIASLYNAQPQ